MGDLTLYQFEGQNLRIVDREGEPWFIATDAARMLGHRDAEKLTRSVDGDEKGTHRVGTPGGEQEVSVISEAGLYRAIIQRRASDAIPADTRARITRFQRWVFHDVLPAIRRTGSYNAEAPGHYTGALPADVIELIRRTDGIVRMLASKVTSVQARIEALDGQSPVPALDFGGTVTAYQIIEMAGVPVAERQRGTAQMVTSRLLTFCAERRIACFRTPAEVNPSRPFRFPQATAGDWLLGESRGAERIRSQIERMKDRKAPRKSGGRQASLYLVPASPSAPGDGHSKGSTP